MVITPPAAAPVVTVAVVEPVLVVTVVVALAPLEPEAAARASAGVSAEHTRGGVMALTLTEGIAHGNDLGLVDIGRARLVGAVMYAIPEVHVGAEAGDVVVRAPQARGLGQHVVNACFLWKC